MFDDTLVRQECLEESIKELECVNKKLAKLTLRKDELTQEIIGSLGHEHEGQKTYEYGYWRVEVKTPFVYSLNKKQYEQVEINLPSEFNPIKSSISYTIDKRLCEKFMAEAPHEVRDILCDIIDKKQGKASITIKERI